MRKYITEDGENVEETAKSDGKNVEETVKPAEQKVEEKKETTEKTYKYTTEDVVLGSTGNVVLLLQEILKARGFKGTNGKPLELDREAGANTIYAINSYQNERRRQGV